MVCRTFQDHWLHNKNVFPYISTYQKIKYLRRLGSDMKLNYDPLFLFFRNLMRAISRSMLFPEVSKKDMILYY